MTVPPGVEEPRRLAVRAGDGHERDLAVLDDLLLAEQEPQALDVRAGAQGRREVVRVEPAGCVGSSVTGLAVLGRPVFGSVPMTGATTEPAGMMAKSARETGPPVVFVNWNVAIPEATAEAGRRRGGHEQSEDDEKGTLHDEFPPDLAGSRRSPDPGQSPRE